MKDIKDTDERRNEFIDAAEKLFKENGIVDTTINAIVKEMDVAKGVTPAMILMNSSMSSSTTRFLRSGSCGITCMV